MISRRNMAIPSVEEEKKAFWGDLGVTLDYEFYTTQTTDDLRLWLSKMNVVDAAANAVISAIDGLDENETLKSNALRAMSAEEAREEAVKEKEKANKALRDANVVINSRKPSGE